MNILRNKIRINFYRVNMNWSIDIHSLSHLHQNLAALFVTEIWDHYSDLNLWCTMYITICVYVLRERLATQPNPIALDKM